MRSSPVIVGHHSLGHADAPESRMIRVERLADGSVDIARRGRSSASRRSRSGFRSADSKAGSIPVASATRPSWSSREPSTGARDPGRRGAGRRSEIRDGRSRRCGDPAGRRPARGGRRCRGRARRRTGRRAAAMRSGSPGRWVAGRCRCSRSRIRPAARAIVESCEIDLDVALPSVDGPLRHRFRDARRGARPLLGPPRGRGRSAPGAGDELSATRRRRPDAGARGRGRRRARRSHRGRQPTMAVNGGGGLAAVSR